MIVWLHWENLSGDTIDYTKPNDYIKANISEVPTDSLTIIEKMYQEIQLITKPNDHVKYLTIIRVNMSLNTTESSKVKSIH